MNLEPVNSDHNLGNHRKLYNTTEKRIRGLKLLGVTRESYGALLSPVVLKHLPMIIISRSVSEDQWNLDSILEALLAEIEARKISSMTRSDEIEYYMGTSLYTNVQSNNR